MMAKHSIFVLASAERILRWEESQESSNGPEKSNS